jgi:N-acetyl sugar amidotransferase
MDTTDPEIQFDAQGVCNHCHTYDDLIATKTLSGEAGRRRLAKIVPEIKRAGAGKPHDCVIGVSGGVDSSYAAYKASELGLGPLAVHVDNGWNSELATKNVELLMEYLHMDLHKEVLDWQEFRDLQLSFLKSSTPDCEFPTDHANVACLRLAARRIGVKYIISGANVRTETHLPQAWTWVPGQYDWRYIRSVHEQFGTVELKTYPHLGLWTYKHLQLTQSWIDILNYLDYVKKDAIGVLQRSIDWRYYDSKHFESIYTRFVHGYILPRKFGYDTRKSHLSSLICAGEMRREAALEELRGEPYSLELQEEDRALVVTRLGLTDDQFEAIMKLPPKSFWDYPSYAPLYDSAIYQGLSAIYRRIGRKEQDV